MSTAFLNAQGVVLAVARHYVPDLAAVQTMLPDTIERVLGAPEMLCHHHEGATLWHQRTGGDGTAIGHYAALTADRALWLHDFLATNSVDHRQVNYRTGLISRLHRYVDFGDPTAWYFGEYRRVEYYTDTARTSLVLQCEDTYVRQPNGMLAMVNSSATWGDPDYFGRRKIRTWYRHDGTPHPVQKITFKVYDLAEAMAEGERRRTNVKRRLKTDVLLMLVATRAVNPAAPTPAEVLAAEADGRVFLRVYRDELDGYIEDGDLSFRIPPAVPNITDDVTHAWLDNDVTPYGWTGPTIRDEILDALQEITS